MNGFKTLVFQDLTHVLPPKSLAIPSKLSTCNLHTAASSRRFWNFFEFANKDEVHRDSEQRQVSKEIVPPEQIAGEIGEIGKIPQSAPAVTSITSMSMNPRMHGYQQLQDSPTNCWNASEPLKEDNLMSLLDGNSVPKTMKWKLKGYKTLRRHQTDEFAFVPGGIYDLDVDLLSDVHNVPKTNFTDASASPARGRKNDIILSTKAIESNDLPRVTPRTEAVQLNNTGTTKFAEKKLEDSINVDLPVNTLEPASGTKVPVAQKVLSLPKADQIKFLPISKPEVPTVSITRQSQPTARYSSQPPDNSQKPPLHKAWLAKTTANGRHFDRQRTMEQLEESDAHSTAPQQSSSAPIKENWRTEAESNVHEESIQAAPAKRTMDETYDQPDRLEANMDAVDVYENRMANNRRDFARASETRTSMNKDPADFAPGPWKHQRNENGVQTRFQGKSDQKSLNSVYESMGIPPKEGPPLNIAGPDLKQQGKTSPCAATQARLQQNGGNASQRQQGSYSFDGGSSMAGNGGGSRKPPAPYPPFTSRRSSSSNSSALRVPSKAFIKGVPKSKILSSNISTTSRRPGPRKCDDDDDGQMIEGKTICTKPREGNNCSRKCEPQKKSKPCKRYCCPALQASSECDWSKSQCPQKGCGGNERRIEKKKKTDPTCLPPQPETECGNEERGREVCTTQRRSCGKRDRGCSQMCHQPSSPRPRCKRERRSCERRERSCDKQQRRQCDREQDRGGREICTKPRRRESCERRRDSCERRRDSCDRDCNRKATKCSGRRNYTQSACTRRPHTRRNIHRFFSMTTLGFSLVGMKHKQSKNTLFRIPSPIRFYGKETSSCDKPTACKTDLKKCKKPPTKCLDQKPPEPKCKIETKTESKCKIEHKSKSEPKCKIEHKSKSEPKCKIETKKNPCQTSCGKSAKKESPCKASDSEADRCTKRRQQICKSAKTSSEKETESTKERAERERKEMQECKKDISGRNKKKEQEGKKAVTGLERVVSPCKQQSGKGSTSCGKTSCAATTLDTLSNPKSSLFLNPDNDFAVNTVSDRLFSTAKFNQFDRYVGENPSDAQQNHYMNTDDDVIAGSGTITNIHQPEDTANDNSTVNNWFLSWFHS